MSAQPSSPKKLFRMPGRRTQQVKIEKKKRKEEQTTALNGGDMCWSRLFHSLARPFEGKNPIYLLGNLVRLLPLSFVRGLIVEDLRIARIFLKHEAL
jgi:hypothetical protein